MIYSDYSQTVSWLKSPLHSAALAAWLIAACYHAALGLQVVIEDYIAHEARKILLVWLSHLTFSLLALVALIALFRILFTG
jgi:succinate dehydrogenase / fumarate reductase membrane anchor subunit